MPIAAELLDDRTLLASAVGNLGVEFAAQDVIGSQVISHTPTALASDATPLNTITLTFDEAIDLTTLTPAAVTLRSPQGLEITILTVTPVAGSNQTAFDLSLADQNVRGAYKLVVGPQVTDLAGNLMNQDGDLVNGETTDAFVTSINFQQTVVTAPSSGTDLFVEDFESWPPVPTQFSFANANTQNETGTVLVVNDGHAASGVQHLRFLPSLPSNSTLSAILAIDLAARSTEPDIWMSFAGKGTGGINSLSPIFYSGVL